MNHEITPKDRLQNQIRLATDVFSILKSDSKIDFESTEGRNEIMNLWGKENFSKIYRELEEDAAFKFHKRLSGDIYKITAEDIIKYKDSGELPE